MRVRLLRDARLYWNYAIQTFEAGTEVEGDLARHLTDNTPDGTTEVLEADAAPARRQAPAPAAPEVAPPGGDVPPVDGTIDDLMTWVAGDPSRAAQALAAEQAKDKPRSTVVKRLAALAGTEE